jgi:imidazolonepropionase-like amidohydrolase
MKCRMLFVAVAMLAVGMALSAQSSPDASSGPIAIVHAKAYLVPGKPAVQNATVVIANGKIKAAGAGLAVPPGVRVIDAKGRILTPGLMNSDSQLTLTETLGQETTDSRISKGPFGSSFDVEYAVNPNSTVIPVVRAQGLTRATVLPTGSAEPPFNGQGAVLRLSEDADILDLPRAAVVAQIGGMVSPAAGGSRSAAWMLLRRALTAAQGNNGSSAGKLDPEDRAALLPVLERKIPLALIVHRESDLRQAVAIADDYKVRVVLVGAEEAWRIADLLASRKIPVVLDPYADAPHTFDEIGARLDNAAILNRAGVPISFMGTFVDVTYNAGTSIREGAGIAVANGLPWNEALKALTLNPAMTWGISDHYGSLEPGKDADAVLWDGDPLQPGNAPMAVWVGGKQVSLETRQTDLERRYSPANMGSPIPPAYRH